MRKLLGLIAVSFLAVGVAGQASATALGFTGVMGIQLATLAPVLIPGAGTAIINGSGGGSHINTLSLAGGTFATSGYVLPVTDPSAAPIKGLQVTVVNASGAFGGAPLAGTMPLIGSTKVCLFGACSAAIANLNVPLSPVGAGGVAFVTAAVNITVVGAPWTAGTVAIGTITAMGGATPASNTAQASGVVSLVTPVFVSTNIGASAVVPVFGLLQLHFVPEPGTLVLLGSGIAGLVSYGRTRTRKA